MVGKDDAVVVVSAKAVPIVPLCQVSGTRDVVGLQCVYSQHPLSHSPHIGASPPWDLNQMLNIVAQKEVGGMASDDAKCATYFPLSHT